MSIIINQELLKLNIDILAKAGIKKSTINKLHKLKAKRIGDLAAIEYAKLEQIMAEDGEMTAEQLSKLVSLDLIGFVRIVLQTVKKDSAYEIIMLHANNHTHQEIAERYGISKEKVKQSINKFLQSLFTLVDAVGSKLIENKPYLAVEELETVCDSEEGYKLLLLAFKAYDTKWTYHFEAECFTMLK